MACSATFLKHASTPTWAGPSHINHQSRKCPLPCQSDVGNYSPEDSTFQINSVCVKLIKVNHILPELWLLIPQNYRSYFLLSSCGPSFLSSPFMILYPVSVFFTPASLVFISLTVSILKVFIKDKFSCSNIGCLFFLWGLKIHSCMLLPLAFLSRNKLFFWLVFQSGPC